MTAPAVTTPDPSRVSLYVSDAMYERVVAHFTGWQRDEACIADLAERDHARRLLEREARLLDGHDYEAWLALLAPECVYWIPGTPERGDPRREIAITFDDRRRLEDRIYRLRTGYAWSQAPRSRTVRMVSNVEVFRTEAPEVRMVRSNFLVSEFWGDETRILTGWMGHRIASREGRWLIEAKQVNLIDCDQCIRNPSIIL
jgi:3-phenylpropionate/cinnamic acid dioxygenase small subunit